MFLRAIALAALCCVPVKTLAAPVDDLLDALKVAQVIDVMRLEGLAYGAEMEQDFLGGMAGAGWSAALSQIYDTDAMMDSVRTTFAERMPRDMIPPLVRFFQSDVGQQIVSLELSARAAMVDTAVEDEARAAFRAMEADEDPRLDLLADFIAANDLLEANVAGAMNASYQFYLGLVDGGAFTMTEDDILADVWGQEGETREDTYEWLYAYLTLAYGPLEDAVIEDYTDLSAAEAGRALNTTLFAAFNRMYDDISYDLGYAAAREMQGEEL